MGLALPLFLVTMASQNVPGTAILRELFWYVDRRLRGQSPDEAFAQSRLHNPALDGAPEEMTRLTLRFLTAAASPVSLVAADDLEVFERCQIGFHGDGPEWLDVSRGIDRDRAVVGELIAPGTSELPIRQQFAACRHWMAVKDGDAR